MRLRGVEPPRAYSAHKALNLARLPVPPQPRGRGIVWGGSGSLRWRALDSVREPRYSTNMCSLDNAIDSRQEAEPNMVELNLTKRQSEIFEFIKAPPRQDRLSADRARDRQGARAALALDRARPPREAREARACCGATRRSRGRSRCWSTAPSGSMRPGRAARRAGRRRQPILAEENIEDQLEIPAVIGADGGDYALRVRGDSMRDAGILEGDFVVVQPGRRRRQRADRRRPDRGRGDRQALLPEGDSDPPSAREPRLPADHHPRRRGPRPGDRRVQEGLIDECSLRDQRTTPAPRGAPGAPASAARRRARARVASWRPTLEDIDLAALGAPGRRDGPTARSAAARACGRRDRLPDCGSELGLAPTAPPRIRRSAV